MKNFKFIIIGIALATCTDNAQKTKIESQAIIIEEQAKKIEDQAKRLENLQKILSADSIIDMGKPDVAFIRDSKDSAVILPTRKRSK